MRRLLVVLLAVGAACLTPAVATAQAETTSVLTLTAPASATLGEPMTLTATLHDASGTPLGGATLRFLLLTDFLGKFGTVEIGRATTDDAGVATIRHEPRQSGALMIRAIFDGTETARGAQVDLETQVVGSRQLFKVEVGTDAPNFEFWGLVTVLSIVWSILIAVAVRIVGIARGADQVAPPESVPEYFREREEWP